MEHSSKQILEKTLKFSVKTLKFSVKMLKMSDKSKNVNYYQTFAESVTLSHEPPLNIIFPCPILAKIIPGVSSGPAAKGVRLKINGQELN